jgi:hypothetical protein
VDSDDGDDDSNADKQEKSMIENGIDEIIV